jgi:hypothetical protein
MEKSKQKRTNIRKTSIPDQLYTFL